MKILMLGAGGVASIVVHELRRDRRITRILCGTKNLSRARQFIKPAGAVRLCALDASNAGAVSRQARGFDLIINASLPDFNETLLRAALQTNTNYQDLATANAGVPAQLKFHSAFQRAGLVGLFNTGVSPGIVNVIAREAADRLDAVESIKIRTIEDQQASEIVSAWSKEHALDTLSSVPLSYRRGAFRSVEIFGDIEEFEFPAPFGRRYVVNAYGDEVVTLPRYLKTARVEYKSAGSDIEYARSFYRLGLFGRAPLTVGRTRIVPFDFLSRVMPSVPPPRLMLALIKKKVIKNGQFLAVVETVGKESGRRMKVTSTARFPDLVAITKRCPGATYISYPTGAAAASFTKIIPRIKKPGVFPPEALEPALRKEVLVDQEARGVVIEHRFSKP